MALIVFIVIHVVDFVVVNVIVFVVVDVVVFMIFDVVVGIMVLKVVVLDVVVCHKTHIWGKCLLRKEVGYKDNYA